MPADNPETKNPIKVCVSGPPSEEEKVPEIFCDFKFTLYTQKKKDRSEEEVPVDTANTSEANGGGNSQQVKQKQLMIIFERF